ncbi:MAG: hypothetical protein L6V81_03795 [Clostridium sp.]|nr:MAG: hypothetical protein L6V81_03795 [Clostridium sp.]
MLIIFLHLLVIFTAGKEVTVELKKVTYNQGYYVTGSEMNSAAGKGSGEYYTYSFKKKAM